MRRSLVVFVVALASVLTARGASAQAFLNPYIDTTFDTPSLHGDGTKPGFGVAFGAAGKIVGFETDISYYPELIDKSANALAKSNVFTFSGSLLVGPRMGSIRPYGAIGAGDLLLNVTSVSSILIPNPASISNNYFTFNAGGGVMGYFGSHLGVRGDLRYFKAYGFNLDDFAAAHLSLNSFDFWRANIGLLVTF
jgi:Outer membrane protein beta-barrel domain